jgi:predicted ATP-dependent protease
MVFWRAKSVKTADDARDAGTPAAPTNVVSLPAARLTERLADVRGSDFKSYDGVDGPGNADGQLLIAADLEILPGQTRAIDKLRKALAAHQPGAHVMVLGPPGTGRRSAAQHLARQHALTLPPPNEWIYVSTLEHPDRLQLFPVGPGEAHRLVRETKTAIRQAHATLDRMIASDDHRLTLDLFEEQHRHRSEKVFDALKRRAEAQNIALVKTLEGYVLAPMHEGRVVRADVFRALPETLQRDVETKMTGFETELQALVAQLPGAETEADQKHAALSRQTATRALSVSFNALKSEYNGSHGLNELIETVEGDALLRATEQARRRDLDGLKASGALLAVGLPEDDAGTSAPVVFARTVSRADLCGEIGRDAEGTVALRPGHLANANGGVLIAEAWRLAAEPEGWATLSAALESRMVTPLSAPGLAIAAAALPLSLTIVLIADDASFTRLQEIDSGIDRHFPRISRFNGTASRTEVTEATFGAWVAALARSRDLLPVEQAASSALYADASERSGVDGAVSLDISVLAEILRDANAIAAGSHAKSVRAGDAHEAIARRKELTAP